MWKHGGIRIDVDMDGKFEAKVGTATIRAESLELAKAKIDVETKAASVNKEKVSLKVCGLLRNHNGGKAYTVHQAILTGVHRTTQDFQYTGIPHGHYLTSPLADCEANRELLADILEVDAQRAALEAEIKDRMITSGQPFGKIELADYPKVINHLKQTHANGLQKEIKGA